MQRSHHLREFFQGKSNLSSRGEMFQAEIHRVSPGFDRHAQLWPISGRTHYLRFTGVLHGGLLFRVALHGTLRFRAESTVPLRRSITVRARPEIRPCEAPDSSAMPPVWRTSANPG